MKRGRSGPAPLVDRLIGVMSPSWALKRAAARAQLGLVRAYEGAQRGRRTAGWNARSAGPVTEVRAGRILLRNRSRDLDRNNAWARRAASILVSSQIGTGIMPRANSANQALNARIDELFARWAETCAPDSGISFYGMQAMAVRARAVSGESLVIMERAGPGAVKLQLQVLEPDWLADDRLDNESREGIVFNDQGTRTGYRLWEANPTEEIVVQRRKTRTVNAGDMIHLFRADRPGQIRGVPDVSAVMMRMRDLDDYHDAALLLAKVQSVLGAFITQTNTPATSTMGTEGTDAAGNRIEELAPGMIGYLGPGEDVKFLAPQGGGPFEGYTRQALLWIAAGFGLPYHLLTGDLTQANYSSIRAGMLEFKRQVEQDQYLLLIPALCQPIWRAFISQAVIGGQLPADAADVGATWTPPRFEMVDPIKDTTALQMQVRSGFISWPDAVAAQGYDPAKLLAEIQDWNGRLTAAGVVLDTDPRLVTGSGTVVDPKQLAAFVLNAES